MAHSIQKKVKFSKGQIAPELVERTDLDIYDSSAQEITNLTSTIYGGLRTRRGTRFSSEIYASNITTGTVTNNIGGNTSAIQTLGTNFVSDNISTVRNLIDINYGSLISEGTFVIKGINIDDFTVLNTSSSTTYIVPTGVNKLHIDCVGSKGADGNSTGGKGGRVQCDLPVSEGQVLYITVGDIPSSAGVPSYNASDIRIGANNYASRKIVAGGGGSGAWYGGNGVGGDGGKTIGQDGTGQTKKYGGCTGGTGGTSSSGGIGGTKTTSSYQYRYSPGSNGQFGLGGASDNESHHNAIGGCGGAGWYGGGGGAGFYQLVQNSKIPSVYTTAGGGGGGSNYTTGCQNVVHTRGYRNGKGYVKIGSSGVKIRIQTSQDGVTYSTKKTYNIGNVAEDINVNLENFQYVRIKLDYPSGVNITGKLRLESVLLSTLGLYSGNIKTIPYRFNNEQEYVIILAENKVLIYQNDEFVQELADANITNARVPDIKYTFKDDTIILTHPNMRTKQLQRTSSGWVLSNFPYTNIPYYAFEGETITSKSVSITPSDTEGAIKITAASSVFSSADVGQFIDGNGGRVRITEYISNTVVNGVTIIPFYTTDAITSWKLISGYEAVWSSTRGYPRTCLFAQQRLWFGGSRDLPTHIWASRINDYNNFKNAGNYDNDAIDITLLTNNPILNMIEQRGIHIFTSGEEWTAAEASLTPNEISIKCNTQNGSLNTEPVVVNGVVMYIEKNGKSLLGYVYNYEQASFVSNNMSRLNNMIKSPKRLAVESNSSTDRGDFLFILLNDGTMLVSCVALDENIFSTSRFITEGKIKDVCCTTSDTYLIVERNNSLRLEKLSADKTDFTKTFFVNGDVIENMSEYDGKQIYLTYTDKEDVDVYNVQDGQVELKEEYYGYVTAGLGFAYRLESNPIAINNKTMTCKKRISKATVYCKDTDRLEFNGQKKKGKDTFDFYACTPYKDDVRFVINGEFYPVNILSVTLNLNYEG